MKKIKLVSSFILASSILGGCITPLVSCKNNNNPKVKKEIQLTYNGGQTTDVIFTNKSEPLVFETTTKSNDKIIIKSVNNNIATIDENNTLVPKYLGTTEVYAYFENDPDIQSNSINVTIEPTQDTLTISDSQVLDSSEIVDNPLGTSFGVITGFKADFTVNISPDNARYMVVPKIDWGESQTSFVGEATIVNPQTDIFGKTTFDVEISTTTDLVEDSYQFWLDFTIDGTTTVKSKPLTLVKRTKEYYIEDSSDEAKFTNNWKKIALTKFLTNIDILSGSVTLTASVGGNLFEKNPPKAVNITNKKHLAGETYQYDVEIVWETFATLDTDGSFNIKFYINSVEVATSKEYDISKIPQAVSTISDNAVYIVDGEKPYAIASFKTNFAFTNQLDTQPFVKAQWGQPTSAEIIATPNSTEIIDITTEETYTTFSVKFTWDERFDDSFKFTNFIVNLTADDKPVLCDEKFEIIWHYGVSYSGSGTTTLIKDEDESFATVSRFSTPDKILTLRLQDIEFSDFTWESTSSLANPTEMEAYDISDDDNFSFGIKLHWDQGFDISQDTYCHVDLIYQNEIIVNNFRFLVKKQSETEYWDITLEEKNASLNVISNTEDLIEIAVSDIAPNSNLGAYYLKVNNAIQINFLEKSHIIYENEVLSIMPGLVLPEIEKSDPLTVGIDYYTAAEPKYNLNVPFIGQGIFEGVEMLSLSGTIDLVKNKPIYVQIDFGALSEFFADTDDIAGGLIFVGSLDDEDPYEWDICGIDTENSYISLEGKCCPIQTFSMGQAVHWYDLSYSVLKESNVIMKLVPTQTFEDADINMGFAQ